MTMMTLLNNPGKSRSSLIELTHSTTCYTSPEPIASCLTPQQHEKHKYPPSVPLQDIPTNVSMTAAAPIDNDGNQQGCHHPPPISNDNDPSLSPPDLQQWNAFCDKFLQYHNSFKDLKMHNNNDNTDSLPAPPNIVNSDNQHPMEANLTTTSDTFLIHLSHDDFSDYKTKLSKLKANCQWMQHSWPMEWLMAPAPWLKSSGTTNMTTHFQPSDPHHPTANVEPLDYQQSLQATTEECTMIEQWWPME